MEEEWRDVNGYEGIYQISNLGRLRSLDRKVKGKNNSLRLLKGKILKFSKNLSGYPVRLLSRESTRTSFSIHRLVANAFLKKEKGKDYINHKNEIKTDNRVENLEWCTASYNNKYNGRAIKINAKRRKPVKATNVISGEEIWFISISYAHKAGFDLAHIHDCCNGYRKTHKGYRWEYIK